MISCSENVGLEPNKRFNAIYWKNMNGLMKLEMMKRNKSDARNEENEKSEGEPLNDGEILDREKWNEYLEIMKLIDDTRKTTGMKMVRTPSYSIDMEPIKMHQQ